MNAKPVEFDTPSLSLPQERREARLPTDPARAHRQRGGLATGGRARPEAKPGLGSSRAMSGGLLALVLALLLGLGGTLGSRSAQAAPPPDSFADLADRLLPAVVNISTTQVHDSPHGGPGLPQLPPGTPFEEFFREFFERQQRSPDRVPRRATSLGSGFIIDEDGIVITNNHVIDGADEIHVILHDDSTLDAEVVGRDPKTDIAVLRIKPEKKLTAVSWGNSDDVRVGDWILAIGNPFGLGGSVTAGIVSARARDIHHGPYDDFLQTDASINRGNSGGPMFNLDGQVIGINTAIYSPSGGSVGIGFAIPTRLAKSVVDQILEFGRTRRGWLGVRIQTVTDEIAESLGLDKARGALVASVTEDGPADKAGIEPGDIILEFNQRDVPEMQKLPRIVAETTVGKTVEVEVWRGDAAVTLEVTIGELEEAEKAGLLEGPGGGSLHGGEDKTSLLGMTLANPDEEQRERFDLPSDAKGVLVTAVENGSIAEEKGLRPGDLIAEVNQEEVSSPAAVVAKVKAARESGRRSVLFLIDRENELRFVALRLDETEE